MLIILPLLLSVKMEGISRKEELIREILKLQSTLNGTPPGAVRDTLEH